MRSLLVVWVDLVEDTTTLADGVGTELTWDDELDGGLNVMPVEGVTLGVLGEVTGLGGDTLEKIVNHGVKSRHSLGIDTNVFNTRLEELVDETVEVVSGNSVLLAVNGLFWGHFEYISM